MPRKIKRNTFPAKGTQLTAKHKGKEYTAIVDTVDEQLSRVGLVVKCVPYRSLSAAAKAITKLSVNGWKFWGLQ